ncbi:MAG: hypothetical protein HIU92_11120 [Proteobacteria bacterium]|nr:hypothetical protein [Pseudomonadota bacterium]
MTLFKPLLLAGITAVALGGGLTLAHAATAPHFKTMAVQLPGGGIEQIEYTGDVPPQVILAPAMPADAAQMPMPMPMGIGMPVASADPFTMLDRISVEMARQEAAMINAVDAITAGALTAPGNLVPAVLTQRQPLPPGGVSYSFVSSVGGGGHGVCTQSLQITAMGAGQAPRVVRSRAGDCGGMPSMNGPADLGVGVAPPERTVPAALPSAPIPSHQPQLIPARYLMPRTGTAGPAIHSGSS